MTLSSCQLGYIIENAYYQVNILCKRIPLDEAIQNTSSVDTKQKLELIKSVREYAKNELGLNVDKNYSTYVELNRDYVTYVVSAAQKNKLEPYKWNFPIVGNVPYKGYFTLEKAKKFQMSLEEEKELDTYLRGVSAFSTLGWFNDPVLSSMLKYSDYDLVSTIIHESVHATFYFKSQAEFNETAASFLGNLGASLFYRNVKKSEKEIINAKQKQTDDLIFSEFITKEINALRKWYEENQNKSDLMNLRELKYEEIKNKFSKEIRPQLSTASYLNFEKIKLNNARLLIYETYMKNFDDLEALYKLKKSDFRELTMFLKSLEKSNSPQEEIKKALTINK